MGGELTYRCLGGMDYEVSLVLYRDCAGIPVATNENLVITSANCAQTLNVSLSVTDTVTITSGCTNIPTWCNGGNAPGMQVYLYQDTVTLPMACTDWVMWNSNCCRNGSILNLMNASAQSSYFEARLDNVNAPCNSAPIYQELQMPFVCNNVMFCLDNGTYDPDGDSLVYSMTPAYNGNINNPIPYNPGYSVADPFPSAGGHAFDPATGNHCAVPNQIGAYVVAYKIDEYRNGLWIGSTSREIQLWVVGCQSAVLGFAGTVTDSTGTAVSSGDVQLWEYGLNSMSSTLISSTTVNGLGQYSFSNLPNGQYLVRAIPDSVNTPGHSSSYHESTHYWVYADVLSAICDTVLPADVQLVGYGNLSGTGYLTGYLGDLGIIRSQQGTAWAGASVLLETWPARELTAFTRTTASGMYSFNNVPNGQYRVIVDHPGLPMVGYYRINVTANNQTFVDLDYGADTQGFHPMAGPTSVADATGISIMLVPNPVGADGLLFIQGLEDGAQFVVVEDMLGRMVLQQQVNASGGRATVSLAGLPQGNYLVRIADIGVARVVKQ